MYYILLVFTITFHLFSMNMVCAKKIILIVG